MRKPVSTPRRWVLMNPGPVNVSERVRRALLKPDICHREEEFSALLRDTREKLLKIFGIRGSHTAVFFSGSGTTALEAMLCSFAEKNKKVLVLSNGVYGDRMKSILEIHESPVRVLAADIGGFPAAEEIESVLKNDPAIHGVAVVHHETSSGMLNPLSPVAALAKKYKKTLLVDAVSSLGAEKIDFKKWGIDYLAGTSGKCLHGFPGVSFVIVSKEESEKAGAKKPRSLALDLSHALKTQGRNDTPFTPAVQIFYAFHEALEELAEEGLSRRIQSYAAKSALLEKGLTQLGIAFLVPKDHRSHVLTALWTPPHLRYQKLHDELKKSGFIIYAGQSRLKDKIFRVSNLGEIGAGDIRRFLVCLKKVLNQPGKK